MGAYFLLEALDDRIFCSTVQPGLLARKFGKNSFNQKVKISSLNIRSFDWKSEMVASFHDIKNSIYLHSKWVTLEYKIFFISSFVYFMIQILFYILFILCFRFYSVTCCILTDNIWNEKIILFFGQRSYKNFDAFTTSMFYAQKGGFGFFFIYFFFSSSKTKLIYLLIINNPIG